MTSPQPKKNTAAILVTGVVSAICLFSHLGALGLVGPDEPRYASIARAMAQTGDWITPRLYGVPWFEKPILYYWAAAIGFSLHLPAEWAARLPSAFAALSIAVAIGWLGWKHYGVGDNAGRETSGGDFAFSPALLAPLIFVTSVAAIGFARAATPDMLFSASIALSMASAAGLLRNAGALRSATADSTAPNKNFRFVTLALFGAFLGFGVLAKGPAAVVLAGGSIGIWALSTSHFRLALRLAHPVAIAAFCLVALPWYVICARRNPDFIHVFIFQHNFERYLTPIFQHRQPFWFFGPITLLALLPWTALLISVLLDARRSVRESAWKTSPGFFFACWAVFPILFFSLSQSKLPSYILPAVPPLAILLAVGAKRGFARRGLAISTSILLALTWVILGIVASEYFWSDPQAAFASKLILAVTLLAAALSVAYGLRKKVVSIIFTSALAAAIAVEIAGLALLPNLDSTVSARERANWISETANSQFYTFHLPRSWNYGLAFYSGRPIEEWSPENPNAAAVLTTPQGLIELKKLGRFSGSVNPAERGMRYVKIEPAAR